MNKLRWLFVATMLGACSHSDIISSRHLASEKSTTPRQCFSAYKSGLQGKTLLEIQTAMSTCAQAVSTHCDKKMNRESDLEKSKYVSASCYEVASYGADKAANSGMATAKCKEAHSIAMSLANTRDAKAADEVCTNEVQESCKAIAIKNPNDKMAGARCNLIAQHGALIETAGGDCESFNACMAERQPNSDHPESWAAACREDYDPNKTCEPSSKRRIVIRRTKHR